MPYSPFSTLFPDVARHQTRELLVRAKSELPLPAGRYAFHEMFCDEAGCDCRRVFFYVVSNFRPGPEAVIAWGWESRAFYARWMRDDDPAVLDSLVGPELNVGSPQSNLAAPLLAVLRDVLATDTDYVARVKAHYLVFRARIERGKGHPSDARSAPLDRVRPRRVP
jgi:hypothetical protein